MRALYLTGKTSLPTLALSDVADPIPQPGEVLIRLAAAALNHRDLFLVHGRLEEACILGSDGAGLIAEANGIEGWHVGDEVLINPSMAWGDRVDAQGDDFFTGPAIDRGFQPLTRAQIEIHRDFHQEQVLMSHDHHPNRARRNRLAATERVTQPAWLNEACIDGRGAATGPGAPN